MGAPLECAEQPMHEAERHRQLAGVASCGPATLRHSSAGCARPAAAGRSSCPRAWRLGLGLGLGLGIGLGLGLGLGS